MPVLEDWEFHDPCTSSFTIEMGGSGDEVTAYVEYVSPRGADTTPWHRRAERLAYLASLAPKLARRLLELEWSGNVFGNAACPECLRSRDDKGNHATDCEHGKLIAEIRKVLARLRQWSLGPGCRVRGYAEWVFTRAEIGRSARLDLVQGILEEMNRVVQKIHEEHVRLALKTIPLVQ